MIVKKCWPEVFELILSGKKNFDVRLDEFECSVGDFIILKEFDPIKNEYTGRELKKEVKYVFSSNKQKYWKKEEIDNKGLVVLGF